jgi:hypothetical protein
MEIIKNDVFRTSQINRNWMIVMFAEWLVRALKATRKVVPD